MDAAASGKMGTAAEEVAEDEELGEVMKGNGTERK
jgi:hypothetical protein